MKTVAKKSDSHELPAYTIAEAAHYLSVPEATIRYWAMGQGKHRALIEIPTRKPSLLSLLNLLELHVLAAIRRKHAVSMLKVRRAIDNLKKNTRDITDKRHSLISRQQAAA